MAEPGVEFKVINLGASGDAASVRLDYHPSEDKITVGIRKGQDALIEIVLDPGNLEDLDLKDAGLLLQHAVGDLGDQIRVDDLPKGISKRYAIWVGRSLWVIGKRTARKSDSRGSCARIEMMYPVEETTWKCEVIACSEMEGSKLGSLLVSWVQEVVHRRATESE
jgi:hypothetical protein